MSVVWHEHPDPESAADAAAQFVRGRLEDALAGQPLATVALSGGRGPAALFGKLARASLAWDRVHFFWVDERSAPPWRADSNFRLANELLLEPARIPKGQIHRIEGELRPDLAASRYVDAIREFFALGPQQMPRFDVAHLGLGADCHTAGLFPGEPLLEDRSAIAAAVYVERLSSWRVTLLPGVLLAASHILFLTTGAEKAEAVRTVLTGPYNPQRWPAQLITHHGRHVVWFLDHAAASKELSAPA